MEIDSMDHGGRVHSEGGTNYPPYWGKTNIHIPISGQFRLASSPMPQMHGLGLWEAAGVPGENPPRHGENIQTS